MSDNSFAVGAAAQTLGPPVQHILVRAPDPRWMTWCSGERGRRGDPAGGARLCRECERHARAYYEAGVLDPSTVGRQWFTAEQLAASDAAAAMGGA